MKLSDDAGLARAMRESKVLAVIGMKPPGGGPAWTVPGYMRREGYTTYAVNPEYPAERFEGLEHYGRVTEIDEPIDMVVLFRNSRFIDAHATEILQMDPLPKFVWMQLGIWNSRATERLSAAGIDVVESRCLAVEHPRLIG